MASLLVVSGSLRAVRSVELPPRTRDLSFCPGCDVGRVQNTCYARLVPRLFLVEKAYILGRSIQNNFIKYAG
jgi:hypothetical protein